MFTPWKCGDCGAHGKINHFKGAPATAMARWTAQAHARKSPECHQRDRERRMAQAQMSPRDRHILVTARIKRKLVADSLRIQRKADPVNTRHEWLAGRATRKGYAFT